ncbi:hypothetical protein [Methylobacterium nigriterrae]|uniref:hypothetical protein n=1 Tax=Methylobacterium nigriterrae TaxID=3127512 RepID=UPI003014004B
MSDRLDHVPDCGLEDERRQAALEQALIRAFWQSLGGHPLPVMTALEAAARAVGLLYGQVSQAHAGPGGCRCGWVPDPDRDLIMLEANLAAALLQPVPPRLARMRVAGQA